MRVGIIESRNRAIAMPLLYWNRGIHNMYSNMCTGDSNHHGHKSRKSREREEAFIEQFSSHAHMRHCNGLGLTSVPEGLSLDRSLLLCDDARRLSGSVRLGTLIQYYYSKLLGIFIENISYLQ